MGSDIIQANYPELEAICVRFKGQAESNSNMYGRVTRGVQALRIDWEGKGSEAFFAEMEQEVFPAMQRLIIALEQAQIVTLEVIKIIQQAEEEAANLFKYNDSYSQTMASRSSSDASPPADPRPPLNQILKDYQVQSDDMTVWSPKGLGVIPIPFTGEFKITETEAKLLDGLSVSHGLLGLKTFNDIKDQAFKVSGNQFPAPNNIPDYVPDEDKKYWVDNDGQRDAFRHAYWNALLTKEFGAEWTTQYTTAHESLPGNQAVREAMDLYNNEVGRQIAIDNPNATDEELANLVRQAVDDGKMVVVDQSGNLAWSNQVPLWEHGVANDTPGEGGKPVPEGDASAQ